MITAAEAEVETRMAFGAGPLYRWLRGIPSLSKLQARQVRALTHTLAKIQDYLEVQPSLHFDPFGDFAHFNILTAIGRLRAYKDAVHCAATPEELWEQAQYMKRNDQKELGT